MGLGQRYGIIDKALEILRKVMDCILSFFLIPLAFLLPFIIILYYVMYFQDGFLINFLLLSFIDVGIIIVFFFCIVIIIITIKHFRYRKDAVFQDERSFRKVRPKLKIMTSNVTVTEIMTKEVGKSGINTRIFSCNTPCEQKLEVFDAPLSIFTLRGFAASRIYTGEKGTIYYYEFNGKNYFEKFVPNSND